MPLPSELEFTDVLAAFITERLKADTVLDDLIDGRVFDAEIPQAETQAERDAMYPCVVFGPPVWGSILKGNGDGFIWAPCECPIIAVGPVDFFTLVPIAIRIREALHGFVGTVSIGGYINSCDYKRPIKAAPPTSEIIFRQLGGLFAIKPRLAAA